MRKKPMLAYPANAKPIDYNKPTFIQPKLDGVRCVIQCEQHMNYLKNEIIAYSRTGKEWKNIDHILEQLIPFFEEFPNHILDGELYNHDFKNDFEKIISMVRKTKPSAFDRMESKLCVQFHCYDIVRENTIFSDRNHFLNTNVNDKFPSIKTVPHELVFNTEEVEAKHENYLELGYEGSILRKNEPYQCKRSWTLMKVKDFSDAEALIVGYEEGKGKREGTLGKFLMQDEDGNKFGCPPGKGYNYQDMRDILNNIHKYMGQTATFTYFERTKAGSYRHPLFKGLRNYE